MTDLAIPYQLRIGGIPGLGVGFRRMTWIARRSYATHETHVVGIVVAKDRQAIFVVYAGFRVGLVIIG
jgi:hypothetical protein